MNRLVTTLYDKRQNLSTSLLLLSKKFNAEVKEAGPPPVLTIYYKWTICLRQCLREKRIQHYIRHFSSVNLR